MGKKWAVNNDRLCGLQSYDKQREAGHQDGRWCIEHHREKKQCLGKMLIRKAHLEERQW